MASTKKDIAKKHKTTEQALSPYDIEVWKSFFLVLKQKIPHEKFPSGDIDGNWSLTWANYDQFCGGEKDPIQRYEECCEGLGFQLPPSAGRAPPPKTEYVRK